jgi:DNA-binding CsgD family transcriptional regulator
LDGLRRSQLLEAFDVLAELAEVDELGEFPQRVAEGMRRLVPCHHAGYTAVELGTSRVHIAADPPESVFAGGPEIFARFAHQNPLLSNLGAGGEPRAGRLSDYLTRRQLHSTELYDYVYRHIPLEYQIGAPLEAPGRDLGHSAEIVGVSLVRTERDFADDELALLELMRPQLSATLTRLHELTLLRALASPDGGGDGRWVLLIEDGNTITWASKAAAAALEVSAGMPLPGELARWRKDQFQDGDQDPPLAAGRAARSWSRPLSVAGMMMQARLQRDAYPHLEVLHLRPLRRRPALSVLEQLGLTRRQAQVLQLAMIGRTASAIGRALCLSPRTVEKHLESIYARLGAANRSEALVLAARALEP